MRVLLDANIYVSYLLSPGKPGTINTIVRASAGHYTLLIPRELARELTDAISAKKSLSSRISVDEAQALLAELLEYAETLDIAGIEVPALTRDAKDDYLLTYAVLGEADYLVTGDQDLLVLDPAGSLRIVTPATFLTILGDQQST